MGESAWRKKNDPNYGKPPPPPDPDERGLVISSPIELRGTAVFMKSSELDPEELRFSLLYWDKFVWPQNMLIRGGEGPDARFLMGEGLLTRPEAKRINGNTSDIFLYNQVLNLQELDTLQPGQWAMAQGERTLSSSPEYKQFTTTHGALLELHRAIPIPDADIPLNEILEFKHKRRSELLALRKHFEDLSSYISASDDPELALQEKLAEVDKACADLVAVGREWQYPIKLGSWNASFNLDLTKATLAAEKAFSKSMEHSLGLTTSIVAAAGTALLSTVSFKPSSFALQGLRRPASPYRYAYSMDKDLR